MKRIMAIAALLVIPLLLSACASRIAAGIGTAESEIDATIENVKRANNIEAKVLVQTPCAMDVGAFHRVLNPVQQQAVTALCGGSPETPITAEDLARMNQFLSAANGQPVALEEPLPPPPAPEPIQ